MRLHLTKKKFIDLTFIFYIFNEKKKINLILLKIKEEKCFKNEKKKEEKM